jgi:hypothetical protein
MTGAAYGARPRLSVHSVTLLVAVGSRVRLVGEVERVQHVPALLADIELRRVIDQHGA